MSWIMTHSGRQVDFVNPDISQVYHIRDVVHALSKIERFTGHGSEEYTVGLHTILGTQYMVEQGGYTDREIFLFLIHDFPEYVLNDISSPLKKLLPDYCKIEERFEKLLYKKFVIEPPTKDEKLEVKIVDLIMLGSEARAFMKYPEKFDIALNEEIKFESYMPMSKEKVADTLEQMFYHYRGKI